jgi:hypothetical protein
MHKLDMRHSRRALAEFDRTAAERDQPRQAAITEELVRRAERNEEIARNAVREAFYLDTADPNSREACMLMPITLIRHMVKIHGAE